jgi:hypothetical protein
VDLTSNNGFTIEDLDEVKNKLHLYLRKDIQFNDPHFTQQMLLRDGDKETIFNNILKPDKLVYVYSVEGKYGDRIYELYFEVSNTRTLKLPVIFDRNDKKSLYILTYVMRYRKWQNMVKSH